MKTILFVLLSAVATVADAGEQPSSKEQLRAKDLAGEIGPARESVLGWLDALRKGDTAKLCSLSDEKLSVFGFDLETGPSRSNCSSKFPGTTPNPLHKLGGSAESLQERERLVACLVQDKLVQDALKEAMRSTEKLRLEPLTPAQGAKRMPQYRKEMRKLPEGNWFHLPRTSHDGVNLAVTILVRKDSRGEPVVRAAFIESSFSE
jgi:hypothetical protein